jgi:hypothetical protein
MAASGNLQNGGNSDPDELELVKFQKWAAAESLIV